MYRTAISFLDRFRMGQKVSPVTTTVMTFASVPEPEAVEEVVLEKAPEPTPEPEPEAEEAPVPEEEDSDE